MRFYSLIIILFFNLAVLAQKSDCRIELNGFEANKKAFTFNYPIDLIPEVGKIENSRSDFEIRYYKTLMYGGELIIFRCVKGKIEGSLIAYSRMSSFGKPVQIQWLYELKPKNSMKDFFEKLNKNGLTTLPTMKELKSQMFEEITLADGQTFEKRIEMNDGISHEIQIKKFNQVRRIYYSNLNVNITKYPQVKELKKAQNLINIFSNELYSVKPK